MDAHRVLDAARRRHYEDGRGALDDALRCGEVARTLGDGSLRARALVLQAAIMLQRGDLRSAVELTTEAEADAGGDERSRAELAAVKSQLSFFVGSYAEALEQARQSVELADATGDVALRLFARRYACVPFGNIGVEDLAERLADQLELAIGVGDAWEEAICRNDLAHHRMEQGDLAGAEAEVERAFALLAADAERNRFALGVVHCTRADIRRRAGRPEDALSDARHASGLLTAGGDPNPYLLAMTVLVEVQALLELGRLDDAARAGQGVLDHLGERVPQARSLILTTVATALREAGRLEEAFDALARAAEVERQAFRELADLQRGLERATLEAQAARRHADMLERKNRHLREQADRDWLTGLHNRRYLAREADLHEGELAGPFSVAIVDLDHFKHVNDRFGHDAGDRVLVRVATLLLAGLREHDTVVRMGGEEFMLLLPGTGERAAVACCERLREAIRDEDWDGIAGGMTVTASFGVATTRDVLDLDALTKCADERLYAAKRAGRDRVQHVLTG
jgi:diguanylate cyclase (GGDEF)-like protein